ncbi:hypothetical protein P7L88_05950 [Bisgaard Taxon 10/6]|uniref:hypothetical protein n=1 Tax=Exercitatus varius TaxID=67857 RepID=UPI00294B6017|nr:hypothetical protein [Exercitatus varius]MDG2948071.1 hypothetical protein [Exercitatus varius]
MLDIKFIKNAILIAIPSGIASFLLAPYISKSNEAMNLIANTFSILSGFLFIVITMSGELALFTANESPNNRIARHQNFETRFTRFSSLFVLYLTVLMMIFIHFLIKDIPELEKIVIPYTDYGVNISVIQKSFTYIITFFSMISFLSSLKLPWTFKRFIEEKNRQIL